MSQTRCYVRGYVERADGAAGDGPVRFVAATEGRKADGIDLRMDRVDLSRFTHNPVIGYGHNYWGRESLPIGRAVTTEVDGPRLLQDVEFDADDEFAATVDRKVRSGFLNAVSIGFEAFDIDDAGVPARWELFETSVVPLPLDPSALVEGRDLELARALGDLRAGKVLSNKNKKLVEDAAAALAALLDAASDEDDDPRSIKPPAGAAAGPAMPRRAAARARLARHLAQ